MALPNKPKGELKAVVDPESRRNGRRCADRWWWYGSMRYCF